jgi:hypothetical protein
LRQSRTSTPSLSSHLGPRLFKLETTKQQRDLEGVIYFPPSKRRKTCCLSSFNSRSFGIVRLLMASFLTRDRIHPVASIRVLDLNPPLWPHSRCSFSNIFFRAPHTHSCCHPWVFRVALSHRALFVLLYWSPMPCFHSVSLVPPFPVRKYPSDPTLSP